jgi:2-methylcitrate dehydratase PrpD
VFAAEKLAVWSAGLDFEQIPGPVVEAAKLHILDAVGTGLAALALDELPAPRAVALEMGGEPEATALGLPQRVGAGPAALANGSMMHALDFDDTHEVALVHSSAVVAATVLAVGEATGASGRDLIAAAVGGYEISSRIGLANPGEMHLRGFHPTSVCGVFAAAAATARLRGLSPEQTANALGIAGRRSPGSPPRRWRRTGRPVPPACSRAASACLPPTSVISTPRAWRASSASAGRRPRSPSRPTPPATAPTPSSTQ